MGGETEEKKKRKRKKIWNFWNSGFRNSIHICVCPIITLAKIYTIAESMCTHLVFAFWDMLLDCTPEKSDKSVSPPTLYNLPANQGISLTLSIFFTSVNLVSTMWSLIVLNYISWVITAHTFIFPLCELPVHVLGHPIYEESSYWFLRVLRI